MKPMMTTPFAGLLVALLMVGCLESNPQPSPAVPDGSVAMADDAVGEADIAPAPAGDTAAEDCTEPPPADVGADVGDDAGCISDCNEPECCDDDLDCGPGWGCVKTSQAAQGCYEWRDAA